MNNFLKPINRARRFFDINLHPGWETVWERPILVKKSVEEVISSRIDLTIREMMDKAKQRSWKDLNRMRLDGPPVPTNTDPLMAYTKQILAISQCLELRLALRLNDMEDDGGKREPILVQRDHIREHGCSKSLSHCQRCQFVFPYGHVCPHCGVAC